MRTAARTALPAAGFRGREADGARLHLERLLSADEVRPVLDPLTDAGEQLALLDLAWWEGGSLPAEPPAQPAYDRERGGAPLPRPRPQAERCGMTPRAPGRGGRPAGTRPT